MCAGTAEVHCHDRLPRKKQHAKGKHLGQNTDIHFHLNLLLSKIFLGEVTRLHVTFYHCLGKYKDMLFKSLLKVYCTFLVLGR